MKFFILLLLLLAVPLRAENWPIWRGPRLDGTSIEKKFPMKWSATENVTWRTELPGGGHSSPIVWNDRIFTVGANPETQERLLFCLDRTTGKLLWQQAVVKSPLEQKQRENSYASSTPATDGARVYCAFLDETQVVLAAYDLAGKQLWIKRPGAFYSMHGFCSTPILYKDKVILNCDHDGDGYIVAMAREDGRELWRIDRPNKMRSYVTPLIREAAGRMQMVLAGSNCVTSYDPDTGKLLWIIDGPTDQFVASMVFSEKAGLFYVTGGFPDHHLVAIKPDGNGNVTRTHVVWDHHAPQGVAYVSSPIIEGDLLLIADDVGVAHAFDAKTGKIVWKQRFGREHASLVSANGFVYFLNDKGVCHVVRAAPKIEVVATNELGENTYASPALSDGQIFLRGEKSIFCIGKRTP